MNLNLQIGSLKDEVASLNILDEKEIETVYKYYLNNIKKFNK